MKSTLTKSELLLKIAKLTNQVEDLTEEEIKEIKIFQKAFMKKFISDDDKLKGEIDKMISTNEVEIMKALFPEASQNERDSAFGDGIIEVARNMKGEVDNDQISKFTGLSLEEIEKL